MMLASLKTGKQESIYSTVDRFLAMIKNNARIQTSSTIWMRKREPAVYFFKEIMHL